MANYQSTPTGTAIHPSLPPLRLIPIGDVKGDKVYATTTFLQFLQQQFVAQPTNSSDAFGDALLGAPPWSWQSV